MGHKLFTFAIIIISFLRGDSISLPSTNTISSSTATTTITQTTESGASSLGLSSQDLSGADSILQLAITQLQRAKTRLEAIKNVYKNNWAFERARTENMFELAKRGRIPNNEGFVVINGKIFKGYGGKVEVGKVYIKTKYHTLYGVNIESNTMVDNLHVYGTRTNNREIYIGGVTIKDNPKLKFRKMRINILVKNVDVIQ